MIPAPALDDLVGTPPRSRLVTAVLVLVIGINPATLYLFLPAMPAIQASFGADTATVQLALSLALVAMTPATLLYGPVSDAYGRRLPLLIASLLIIIGSIIAATATSIAMLIVGRIIQACGAAAGPVLSNSIVFDIHGDERAGPALARIVIGMVAVTMVTPTVGGVLTDYAGWRSNFVMTVALGVLLLVAVWRVLPETHPSAGRASLEVGRLFQAYGRLLRDPVYLAYAVMASFTMGILYAFLSAAPHIMVHLMDRTASDFGVDMIGVAIGFLVGNVIAAKWTLAIGRTRMIVIGSSLALACCLALTIALYVSALTSWTIFVPAILIAVACGMSLSNAEAAALGAIPALSGAASSLMNGLMLAMSAIVSQAVGWTLGETPYPLGISMSIVAFLALASLLISRISRGSPAESAR